MQPHLKGEYRAAPRALLAGSLGPPAKLVAWFLFVDEEYCRGRPQTVVINYKKLGLEIGKSERQAERIVEQLVEAKLFERNPKYPVAGGTCVHINRPDGLIGDGLGAKDGDGQRQFEAISTLDREHAEAEAAAGDDPEAAGVVAFARPSAPPETTMPRGDRVERGSVDKNAEASIGTPRTFVDKNAGRTFGAKNVSRVPSEESFGYLTPSPSDPSVREAEKDAQGTEGLRREERGTVDKNAGRGNGEEERLSPFDFGALIREIAKRGQVEPATKKRWAEWLVAEMLARVNDPLLKRSPCLRIAWAVVDGRIDWVEFEILLDSLDQHRRNGTLATLGPGGTPVTPSQYFVGGSMGKFAQNGVDWKSAPRKGEA